jgi:hypothetical protein
VKVKATDSQRTDYSLLSIIENRIYFNFNVFSSIEPIFIITKKTTKLQNLVSLATYKVSNEIVDLHYMNQSYRIELQFQFTWCILSFLLKFERV